MTSSAPADMVVQAARLEKTVCCGRLLSVRVLTKCPAGRTTRHTDSFAVRNVTACRL